MKRNKNNFKYKIILIFKDPKTKIDFNSNLN